MSSTRAEPPPAAAAERIPGPPLARVLGRLLCRDGGRREMRSGLEQLYREYGPVVSVLSGRWRLVHLFGPDANRQVLLDRDGIFSARRPWMNIMGRIFPNGLLLRDGEEHRHHRRIVHEAFKRPVLREYVRHMHPMIRRGLDAFEAEGRPVHAFPRFKALTLDMAASIFVGADLPEPARGQMNAAFEDMVAASMSRLRLPLPGLEFDRGLRGRRWMLERLREQLPARRAGRAPDLFSRLCHAETEDGQVFDDTQVLDHMVFLMMAAHDTTTSSLTSLTYELARHPEWQERAREESRALGPGEPGLEELDRLESLGWCLQETLRRYPPLPVIPRICNEEFGWLGHRIPADTMVVVSPIVTHYMAEWWNGPERFDPERFSPARAEHQRHTHSWIPFGGGVHLCVGKRFAEAQIRSVMHQLLLRFRWSVPEGYRMPVQQAPISKPRDGLPVRFTPLAA